MKKMISPDIEKMSGDEWISYRRETIEKLESLGYQLLPTAGCSTCDAVNDYVCFDCECLWIDESRDKYNATLVLELEGQHHSNCPAVDKFGCSCAEIEKKVEKLLEDYHPNEIGRLVGLPDNEAKKLVREIYFGWGYTELDDWVVQEMGEEQFVLCLKQGDEWIDENGDYRYFDSKKEARSHLRKSLRLWHEQVALNTYS
jgi:hypothetical protein